MIKQHVAVLMTCYNRKDKTLRCLKELFNQKLPRGIEVEVFLVDDGSPDQTGQVIKEVYPQVHVIQGTGNLYWGGGMRLAWDEAVLAGNFDFYLWLNDDVVLGENAVQMMLDDRDYVLEKFKIDSLVSGCVCCPETKMTTYSGNNQGRLAEPTGVPQSCLYSNGNVVLVPRSIFDKIGNISKKFPHQLGDGDYGLRSRRAGFGCYTSSRFVGTCEFNNKLTYYDPKIPLKKRLAILHSPTGMPPNQRFIFCLRHRGFFNAVFAVVTLYANTLLPRQYSSIKKGMHRGG